MGTRASDNQEVDIRESGYKALRGSLRETGKPSSHGVNSRLIPMFYGLVQPMASSMGWISGLAMNKFQHNCVR